MLAAPERDIDAGSYATQMNGTKRGANAGELFGVFVPPKLEEPGKNDRKRTGGSSFSGIDVLVMQGAARNQQADATLLSQTAFDTEAMQKLRVDQYVAEQVQRNQELKKKYESLDSTGFFASVCKWATKFLGPISVLATAALTVVTAGAAAPLLAIAVLGMAGSALSSAGVDLAGSLSKVVSKGLCALGVPKETADKLGNTVAGCMALCPVFLFLQPSALGKLFRGVAELCGADKKTAQICELVGGLVGVAMVFAATIAVTAGSGIGSAISSSTSSLARLAMGLSLGATLGSGGVAISSAVSDIRVGLAQLGVDMAQADRRMIEQLVGAIREELGQVHDVIKMAFDEVGSNCKATAQMISDYASHLIEQASTPIAA
jgi:hypothetical protein